MAETLQTPDSQQILSTQNAQLLATTKTTIPQMVGITPRWFLQLVPWVNVETGLLRVNRRRIVQEENLRILVSHDAEEPHLDAGQLRALVLLREVDGERLESLASRFRSERVPADQAVVEENSPGEKFYIIVSGKVELSATGRYEQRHRLAVLGEGDFFGELELLDESGRSAAARTLTPCTFLTLTRSDFTELLGEAPEVRRRLNLAAEARRKAMLALLTEQCEGELGAACALDGETPVTESSIDYEAEPREYSLSVLQTILRVDTRVTDIYNEPHDQLQQQLRLAIEGVKERQEWELINNREFGLLHVAAPSMRVQTRSGPPTPDDLDELLARVWKKPAFFLAHPRAIAAFGRECTRRGVPPPTVEFFGSPFLTWRGVPLVPCNKLPFEGSGGTTTSILLLRVGEEEQGVIGLHQTGVPGEQLPSLSVRLMSYDRQGIAAYLISLYFSLAVLVDDAVGVLENVDIAHYHDYA